MTCLKLALEGDPEQVPSFSNRDILIDALPPMKQLSLATTDFVTKPKQTRREKFLIEMEDLGPAPSDPRPGAPAELLP